MACDDTRILQLPLEVASTPLGRGTSGEVSRLFQAVDGGRYVVKEVKLQATSSSLPVGSARAVACAAKNAAVAAAADQSAGELEEVRLHRLCSAGCDSIVRYAFSYVSGANLLVLMEACDAILYDAIAGPSPTFRQLTAGSAVELERLTQLECKALSVDICAAVRHLHSLRVLHRDVNPWNVFLVRGSPSCRDHDGFSGNVRFSARLGDFGLAAVLPSGIEELQGLECDGAVALDDSALGSLYSSPELGKSYGMAADAFSLGMTLFALWKSEKCGSDEDVLITAVEARKHAANSAAEAGATELPPNDVLNKVCDAPLGSVIERLLSGVPQARPSAEVAYEAAVRSTKVHHQPTGPMAVLEIFRRFDTDNNRKIQLESLLSVFAEVMPLTKRERLLEIFAELALPGRALDGARLSEGLVDYEAFLSWLFKL